MDAGTNGRVSHFSKHFKTHKNAMSTKSNQTSISSFAKKRTWEETIDQEFPPEEADDDIVLLDSPNTSNSLHSSEIRDPDLGMDM